MRTPRFLLGAALVFWGWQTGFLVAGVVMALLLEVGRFLDTRWELSDDDFARIWTFCTLLFLAGAVYAFTANEGPSEFRGFFQNPGGLTSRNASTASARTTAAIFRWLPMIFFFFVAAQEYSSREAIPLETISLILRRRWKKARKSGQVAVPQPSVNVSYPYYGLCLFSASVHQGEDSTFFWGLCGLLAWGLWPHRSRRFGLLTWAASLGLAVVLGYVGQRGISQLQNYLNNLNPEWLSMFSRRRFDLNRNRTDLGRIGRIKTSGKIVIRLETKDGFPPPPLLHENSYQVYKERDWSSDIQTNDLFSVTADSTNENAYALIPGKTNSAAVSISCYLENGEGLLPLPRGCGRVEKLTAWLPLAKSPLGAVMATGPGVVVFDALYGPGPTFDAAPSAARDLDASDHERLDVRVPEREKPALDQVIQDLGLREQPPEQAIRTLHAFFLDKFSYSVWQEPGRYVRVNDTPITRFLRQRKGHCEYFATAGVLLLRELQIPARYAVGWAVHEGAKGKYLIRQRDAHAWCMVWDQKTGLWRDVDFTPGSWLQIEGQRASRLQALFDVWSGVVFEISKFRWGQTHLRQYIFWALIPVLGVLFYQIIFRRRGRRKGSRDSGQAIPASGPGLDSEFYEIETKLVRLGLVREASEPLWGWVHRALNQPGLAGSRPSLEESLRLHYRYRFDPAGISKLEREKIRLNASACLASLPATLSELR